MSGRALRSRIAAFTCLAAVSLTASCQSDPPGTGTSAKPAPSSIFDDDWVSVAVKKGQPGFNTRSAAEYEYAGFETDLVNYLADTLKFRVDPRDFPSQERENVLLDKRADLVVATYTITDLRDEKIDFTAPYLKTYQGVLVRRDDTRIKKLEDLKGKGVCTAQGSTSSVRSKDALGVPVRLELRKDYKVCVNALRKGNVDAVWTDRAILEGFAQSSSYADDVQVVENIETSRRQFYGIGMREGSEADCRKLNKALKKFLHERWRSHFMAQFKKLTEKDENFEHNYKPSGLEFEEYEASSCGADD